MRDELDSIERVIEAFQKTQAENNAKEIINGVAFFYTPADFTMTDEILDDLFAFSLTADDAAYTVYLDKGGLVIY